MYTLAIEWRPEREAQEGVEDLDLCNVSMGWDVQRSQREGKKAPGMKVSMESGLATSRAELSIIWSRGWVRARLRSGKRSYQRNHRRKDEEGTYHDEKGEEVY